MATIRPFKAIRPPRDKAHLLASRSYVSYSDKTLKEKLENNELVNYGKDEKKLTKDVKTKLNDITIYLIYIQ